MAVLWGETGVSRRRDASGSGRGLSRVHLVHGFDLLEVLAPEVADNLGGLAGLCAGGGGDGTLPQEKQRMGMIMVEACGYVL